MGDNLVYHGKSDSFSYIADCYLDYGRSIIKDRALPDIRDGLKPVQRRILYSALTIKKDYLAKCITIVSEAMKLHPHGNSSVWGAFCLMVDSNGSFNLPLFVGRGNLGRVYSSASPAAERYPQYMLHKNHEYFFRDKEVMQMIRSEEGDGDEPVVLPVIFPNVLVNGTEGIAVSAGTKIPHFNLIDVLDLTIKYLRDGKLDVTDIIIPDFPTGGILVQNDAELAKIMATGKGKLKIRANVEIVGKEIIVKEVPFGRTVQSIIQQIKKSGMKEISFAMELSERDNKGLISIECKSKRVVEYVLMELYRRNILQTYFSSNMLMTEGDEPCILGVHGVIKRWCKWRSAKLREKFNIQLESISSELELLSYFTRLISNQKWKEEYIRIITREGANEADAYLKEIFGDIPFEVCKWIRGRAISAFNNGGKYTSRYNDLLDLQDFYTESAKHPENYIINELSAMIDECKDEHERKTKATYTDYRFSKITDTDVIEDDSYCVWTLTQDGFLLKTRSHVDHDKVLCQFEGNANSVLVGFDCFGRVLRVAGSDIDFTDYGDNGTYLPKYFDGGLIQDDYKILYLGLLDGTKRMLVYRDGYIGFFDTSEWEGKKVVRIVNNGVSLAVYDKLLEVYEEYEIPQVLMLADDTYDEIRIALVRPEDVIEKSRKSRTRAVQGKDINVVYLKGLESILDSYRFIERPEEYAGKLKPIKDNLVGDPGDLVSGRYYGICVDYENDESAE